MFELPPDSPKLRTVDNKKEADQGSVGGDVVERTRTSIPLLEKSEGRRPSDGSVINRRMTSKNARIPRKTQSRKSSSMSDLSPVSPGPNMKESKGDRRHNTWEDAGETKPRRNPRERPRTTSTSSRRRSSASSMPDLREEIGSEKQRSGGKQGRRNSLARPRRRLSLPLPVVEREKPTTTTGVDMPGMTATTPNRLPTTKKFPQAAN